MPPRHVEIDVPAVCFGCSKFVQLSFIRRVLAVRLGVLVCIQPKPPQSKPASKQAERERQYPSSSRLPLFALTSHINGGIHMQRMFFLPYSQKPLRLQRMGRRAKSCLLHIQNPLSDDKVCLHSNAAPHSMRRWILLKAAAVGSLSPFIYLLSGFSAPLHQTQTIGHPSLQRLAPIAYMER